MTFLQACLLAIIILPLLFFLYEKIKYVLADNIDCVKWENPENIKVYIPKFRNAKLMKKAFEEWSNSVNGKIKFVYCVSKDICDIEVIFIREFHLWDSEDGKIGLAESEYDDTNHIMSVKIYVAERDVESDTYNDNLYNTMLHEIGHSIGLMHHSKKENSIMYPVVSDIQKITEEEINRLKRLYRF